MIANYIPLEGPAAGPNFYEFGDDVLYEIHVDNNGDGMAEVTYQFQLQQHQHDPQHVLVQRRADRVTRLKELEPKAVLFRHEGLSQRED